MNTLISFCKAALAADESRIDLSVTSIALVALIANGVYFFG